MNFEEETSHHSRMIVLDTIWRLRGKLSLLERLIKEYCSSNPDYIPTSNFLDNLSQAELYLNELISMAEYSIKVANRQREREASEMPQPPKDNKEGYI